MAVDCWNGTAAQVRSFKNNVGANFPYLLNGAGFQTSYGPYHDYVVVSKQHIVRYNARLLWSHEEAYQLDEIRGCIDSLVAPTVAVGDGAGPRGFGLVNAPNPFRGATTFTISNPSDRALAARVEVLDLAGRRVASLWDAPLPPGTTHVSWDARSAAGAPLPAGLYLVRGAIGDVRLSRRVIVLH